MKTPLELRKEGWVVNISHLRWCQVGQNAILVPTVAIKLNKLNPLTRGGITMAFLHSPNGKTAKGEAYCSINDNFCKKIGREIAIEGALDKLQGME